MDRGEARYAEGRRHATVLVADVSGSTALGEHVDAEDITILMNRCFTLLESAVIKNGGTVIRFIGDCVMAVFGVPTALEDAPRNAVNAAIEMRIVTRDLFAQTTLPV